jgi:hypothetical protein
MGNIFEDVDYLQPENRFSAEEPGKVGLEPGFTIEQSHIENGVTVIDKVRLTEVSLVRTPHTACPFCGALGLSPWSTRLGPTPFYIRCETCGAQGPKSTTIAQAWQRWDAVAILPVPGHKHYCPDCLIVVPCGDQACKISPTRPCGCIENQLGR